MHPIIFGLAWMMILSTPLIVSDTMRNYDILHAQYPGLTVEMYNALMEHSREYYKPITFPPVNYTTDYKHHVLMMCAVMNRESEFRNVIGYTGSDIGVCQVNRVHTGKDFLKYFDINLNIQTGLRIYRSALLRAGGNERNALAYYNAGENINLKDYQWWHEYVDEIMASYDKSQAAVSKKPIVK